MAFAVSAVGRRRAVTWTGTGDVTAAASDAGREDEDMDEVEDGDEGLSPGERGKQQAERAQASDGQGPSLGRKRRAESAAGSEQGKVPRVAHTQRVFLQYHVRQPAILKRAAVPLTHIVQRAAYEGNLPQ
ncbi:hypothetical protein WJX75_009337 [Coccomyxa subellipsoidea]|uniref:Histone H2A/H2B/H3 domain-containing protein n=1 Tax=Coccomyxa subellipsoidea TaxID=248742 RepID=A0ABR2Z060_9CHLO